MQIYNSKTDSLEEFRPISINKLNMYVCGPTLYSDIHIGNARPIIFFDIVARYFRTLNYEVKYVSNVTDIDDKIIKRANDMQISEEELTSKTVADYQAILNSLDVSLDIMPKVTNYITQIIQFIEQLIENGFAYESDGDVYFRTSKIEEYGQLSNREIDEQINGIRVDINLLKEFESDFVLWKQTEVGINYSSPWSKGRPGWHTECVVMIREIFNTTIDIHGGGVDLKFPHHENENAQSHACNCELANYWMHNGFVNVDSVKMSKSIGNVLLVKDLLDRYHANVLRLLLIQNNYRAPINLTEEFINYTQNLDHKLQIMRKKCGEINKEFDFNNQFVAEIKREFDNDFNTANVITILLKWSKLEFTDELKEGCKFAFYVLNYQIEVLDIPEEVKILIEKRNVAKSKKEYSYADELRSQINSLGYDILDTRDGVECQKI